MLDTDFLEDNYQEVYFHYSESLPLSDKIATGQWIYKVAKHYKRTITALCYIFCDDNQLLKLNRDHLNHDTYTDIITFDYSEDINALEGDIYISIERIAENAVTYQTTYDDELHRVMIHGLLHLIGYGDKTNEEKAEMRENENACLSLREK